MKIATALRNHSNNKADIAASLLKACSSLSHLKQIHAHIFRSNLHRNASLASTRLSVCLPLFHSLYSPRLLLFLAPKPLSVQPRYQSFSKLPSFCFESVNLYVQMVCIGIRPDNHTYPFLLNSCAALNDLNRGTEVHGRVVRSGFGWCIPVANALIDMYGKCDALERARLAFDEMCVRDVVSHNALLGACAKGKVDMVGSQALFDGMPVKNVISWNAMIVGYVNCGDLNSAQAIFDRMPERNIVSWTTMLVGYTKNGFIDLAEVLFDKMPDQSLVCWTAMISAYAQSKRPSDALKLFWRMEKERIKPDAFTMTAVISASAQLGHADLANWMGSYMDQAGIEQNEQVLTALPDCITFVGVLTACRHTGLVEEGMRYWESMAKDYKIEPNADHYACFVDMLGRAGKLNEAHKLVKSMPMGPQPRALGALLAACRTYGNVEIAEEIAEQLFELEPENTGNYILLSSIYASKEKWNEARKVREAMRKES
ncbi:hypothetical protein FNV43_RR19531 [Rhamnella rubrinervis]|uniref:Pentatricopeptide repeat-containing protein n=1 Tax=Rhamnella rubrinervis TaxID=2594499 RepID=A0A8K0DWZ7_9ROSA|nr:hypothetical protein FNV43_RR19531 [Rhamnella rubrinervis]